MSLELTIGPMFSGKTTWLNLEITKMADIGKKCVIISHELDKRETCKSEKITTHNSSYCKFSDNVTFIQCMDLGCVYIDNFDIIGIDEAQFFQGLYNNVFHWVENLNKHVKVVGLCGDYERKKFGEILDLIPICDSVNKLNAYCDMCVRENKDIKYCNGPFTKRIFKDKFDKEKINVGGKEKYNAVCRYHYNEKICDNV